MAKMLPEVYFAEMLAGNISEILWLLVRVFSPFSHCPKNSSFLFQSCRKIGKKSGKDFIPDVVQYTYLFNDLSGNLLCMIWHLLVSICSIDVLASGLPAVLPE